MLLAGLVVVLIPTSLHAYRIGASVSRSPDSAWQRALAPVGGMLARVDETGLRSIDGRAGESELVDSLMVRLNENDAYTVPIVLLLTWLWFLPPGSERGREAREQVALTLTSMVAAIAAARILTKLWPYPRPLVTEPWVQVVSPDVGVAGAAHAGAAYPSDHPAQLAAVVVSLLLWNRLGPVAAFAAVPALVMTAPRLYIGWHYPTDMVGGALVGALAAGTVHLGRAAVQPALQRGLAWADRYPHVFYPLALLVVLDMIQLLHGVRALLRVGRRVFAAFTSG